ncbi:unnamed protein product [Fraxinus pennsylvanica]|uniref:Uncharacterized protein n=1 Tax=Fraxinus pennsylvanica TaxID=56036 RepID=A0AAD2DSD6_9LAMI|nr:unnamed protein product [Fraxinus pennsylvanica]
MLYWQLREKDIKEEELNGIGEFFLVRKHPKLKVKLVDGISLAVAIVLNNIPKGTTQLETKALVHTKSIGMPSYKVGRPPTCSRIQAACLARPPTNKGGPGRHR